MFVSGTRCYGARFPPEITLRITLKNTQQISLTIYGSANYIGVSDDPWKPFWGQFCCVLDVCITRNDVAEVVILEDGWICHKKSIFTFLPTENSFYPLTANFGLNNLDFLCPLNIILLWLRGEKLHLHVWNKYCRLIYIIIIMPGVHLQIVQTNDII